MTSDDRDKFEAESPEETDEWEEFREEDSEPIGIEELKRLNLQEMPEDIRIWIIDDYFPETTVWREGEFLICKIEEHLYTKYWEHKFSAYAFAEAMERAVLRLAHEGHPFADPSRDDEDVHILANDAPLGCSTGISCGIDKICIRYGVATSRFDPGEL